MESKELEAAEAHLTRAEADLTVTHDEKAAEHEIEAAIHDIHEAERHHAIRKEKSCRPLSRPDRCWPHLQLSGEGR